jgi:protein tyrosine phosphatase (PTP) superfamily phosphohydrolase (DUF442 family)
MTASPIHPPTEWRSERRRILAWGAFKALGRRPRPDGPSELRALCALAALLTFGGFSGCAAAPGVLAAEPGGAGATTTAGEPSREARLSRLDAPNIVPISASLTTSGQPSAGALAQMGGLGVGGVIYLAPESVASAVAGEGEILARQGVRYVNIPIPFDYPTMADFETFRSAMARLADRPVWVHCQINLRASSMVFLHRVIVGHEPPELAYEAVVKVWSPDGPWHRFIVETLKHHGIVFEPY